MKPAHALFVCITSMNVDPAEETASDITDQTRLRASHSSGSSSTGDIGNDGPHVAV